LEIENDEIKLVLNNTPIYSNLVIPDLINQNGTYMIGINNVYAAFSKISMNIISKNTEENKSSSKKFVTNSNSPNTESKSGSDSSNNVSQDSSNTGPIKNNFAPSDNSKPAEDEELATNVIEEIEDNNCLINNNRETRQFWCKQQSQNVTAKDIY